MDVIIATEDILSECLLEQILASSGCEYRVHTRLRKDGFGYLRSKMTQFNNMAAYMPVFVLTDLDRTECAPSLCRSWLPDAKSPNLLFRVAVRETESWLLADGEALAEFLGISRALIPRDPDEVADPKRKLLELVKRSAKRQLREELLPRSGSTSPIGIGYNEHLCSFVSQLWKVERAICHSPSLARAFERIAGFRFATKT